jgi:enamine deaminase RidA (YjgF/YER057c/UK114 family)
MAAINKTEWQKTRPEIYKAHGLGAAAAAYEKACSLDPGAIFGARNPDAAVVEATKALTALKTGIGKIQSLIPKDRKHWMGEAARLKDAVEAAKDDKSRKKLNAEMNKAAITLVSLDGTEKLMDDWQRQVDAYEKSFDNVRESLAKQKLFAAAAKSAQLKTKDWRGFRPKQFKGMGVAEALDNFYKSCPPDPSTLEDAKDPAKALDDAEMACIEMMRVGRNVLKRAAQMKAGDGISPPLLDQVSKFAARMTDEGDKKGAGVEAARAAWDRFSKMKVVKTSVELDYYAGLKSLALLPVPANKADRMVTIQLELALSAGSMGMMEAISQKARDILKADRDDFQKQWLKAAADIEKAVEAAGADEKRAVSAAKAIADKLASQAVKDIAKAKADADAAMTAYIEMQATKAAHAKANAVKSKVAIGKQIASILLPVSEIKTIAEETATTMGASAVISVVKAALGWLYKIVKLIQMIRAELASLQVDLVSMREKVESIEKWRKKTGGKIKEAIAGDLKSAQDIWNRCLRKAENIEIGNNKLVDVLNRVLDYQEELTKALRGRASTAETDKLEGLVDGMINQIISVRESGDKANTLLNKTQGDVNSLADEESGTAKVIKALKGVYDAYSTVTNPVTLLSTAVEKVILSSQNVQKQEEATLKRVIA